MIPIRKFNLSEMPHFKIGKEYCDLYLEDHTRDTEKDFLYYLKQFILSFNNVGRKHALYYVTHDPVIRGFIKKNYGTSMKIYDSLSKFLKSNFKEKNNVSYSYGNLQVNLSSEKDLVETWKSIQSLIPKDDIYNDPEDPTKGLEDEPHITVCYGFKKDEDAESFMHLAPMQYVKQYSIGFKEVSSFRKEDLPYDVLIVKVNAPKLNFFNSLCREKFDIHTSFSIYAPHMTLSYIKKGTCKNLEGAYPFKDNLWNFEELEYSSTDNKKVTLTLGSM